MTVAGSDDADARFTPTKHCFTANSVKEVDEACMQLQGLMLFASGFSSETLDSRNTVKRGTDCDPGAFAKCTYQKGSVEHIEYAYPKKGTDINKMIEERSSYCKERNGIFSKL
jgi:hypothetical protein